MDSSGKCFSRIGFMCAAVSVGLLLRKEHASSSAKTAAMFWSAVRHEPTSIRQISTNNPQKSCLLTSQPIYRPLLKLLESNIGCGGVGVKVETVRVLGVFELRRSKLLLPVVDDIAPLGINPIIVLPQHLGILSFIPRS